MSLFVLEYGSALVCFDLQFEDVNYLEKGVCGSLYVVVGAICGVDEAHVFPEDVLSGLRAS